MKPVFLWVLVFASFWSGQAASQNTSPFSPGEIFIDQHGSTLQIVQCREAQYDTECVVHTLQQTPSGGYYGPGTWWPLSLLRASQEHWIRDGNAPYSGPITPLPDPASSQAAQGAGTGGAMGGRCAPATPYAGGISKSEQPSAALFQQLLDNIFVSDGTPDYPRNVQFLSFAIGDITTNNVGLNSQGANRVTNGAPAGAEMYPIYTSFVVCKEEWTHKQRYDSIYFCWRGDNEWACGVSESQMSSVPY